MSDKPYLKLVKPNDDAGAAEWQKHLEKRPGEWLFSIDIMKLINWFRGNK
jgi:hypothetical protein